MSWNLTVFGSKKSVKAVVLANPSIPQSLKDAIAQVLDAGAENAVPYPAPSAGDPTVPGVRIETTGHYSPTDSYSQIGKLQIENIRFVPDVAAPESVAPPQPTS